MRRHTTKPGKARRQSEQGYVLLYLLFLVAVLTLSLVTVLPYMDQQRKRDREEEMVHRGVQYSRAVRRYFRKFGSYPASIEALENTNDIRFLRKHYKDPITGKDFRVLHQTDVKFFGTNSIAGGQNLGQPIGAGNGGTPTDPNAATGTATPPPGTDPNATDPSQAGNNAGQPSTSPFTTASGKPAGDTFGGGPLVGVASSSPLEGIRAYNKKTHYNEWQFVYDPSQDRGALIVGPYQPTLQSLMQGMQGQGLGQGGNMTPGTIPGMLTPGTVSQQPHP